MLNSKQQYSAKAILARIFHPSRFNNGVICRALLGIVNYFSEFSLYSFSN